MMGAPQDTPHRIRFGVFEVDLRAAELRKHGLRVKLQAQPFQVLAMLLERPGEVVTREELRRKLWSDDTFVDFDQGLNKVINKIREALSDSADNPRFVETLARRGYRFIYPVEAVETVYDHGKTSTVAERRYSRRTLKLLAVSVPIALVAVVLGLNVAGLRDRLLRRL